MRPLFSLSIFKIPKFEIFYSFEPSGLDHMKRTIFRRVFSLDYRLEIGLSVDEHHRWTSCVFFFTFFLSPRPTNQRVRNFSVFCPFQNKKERRRWRLNIGWRKKFTAFWGVIWRLHDVKKMELGKNIWKLRRYRMVKKQTETISGEAFIGVNGSFCFWKIGGRCADGRMFQKNSKNQ